MYGYQIETDYPLLREPIHNSNCQKKIFCYRDDRIRQWEHTRCKGLVGTNRYRTILSYQCGNGKFVVIKDMGVFYIENNCIRYCISFDCFSEEAICTAISTHIMGNIILEDNYLIHATTLSKKRHAVCFLGESGAGKSTFSVNLILNCGYTLLADDMTAVTQINQKTHTYRGNVYTKLWKDTFVHFFDDDMLNSSSVKSVYKNDGKLIFQLPNVVDDEEPLPLDAIVILCRRDNVSCEIHRINATDSLALLYRNNYISYACSRQEKMTQVKYLAKIISGTPVYLLTYRSGYEYLGEAVCCMEKII